MESCPACHSVMPTVGVEESRVLAVGRRRSASIRRTRSPGRCESAIARLTATTDLPSSTTALLTSSLDNGRLSFMWARRVAKHAEHLRARLHYGR